MIIGVWLYEPICRVRGYSALPHMPQILWQSLGVPQLAPSQPCILPANPVLIARSRSSLADNLSDLLFLLFGYGNSGLRLLGKWRCAATGTVFDRCHSVLVCQRLAHQVSGLEWRGKASQSRGRCEDRGW